MAAAYSGLGQAMEWEQILRDIVCQDAVVPGLPTDAMRKGDMLERRRPEGYVSIVARSLSARAARGFKELVPALKAATYQHMLQTQQGRRRLRAVLRRWVRRCGNGAPGSEGSGESSVKENKQMVQAAAAKLQEMTEAAFAE